MAIHQWIYLNKLYKQMEKFFQIRFRINCRKNQKILKQIARREY